ncbi:MAG: PEP-CTERM sorting domain-containing protein [Phycisphaeraceae bacterium]
MSLSAAAHGQLVAGYTAGSGDNASSLIIDFGFLGADAYLFTYRFDGSATGQEMLAALDAAGDLDVDSSTFDFGTGPILFINGFSFAGQTAVPDFSTTGQTWRYWIKDDRPDATEPYVQPEFGISDRNLTDGSVDAFGLDISEFNTLGLEPTVTPPPLVPEPGSATLFALTGFAALARRRRSTR